MSDLSFRLSEVNDRGEILALYPRAFPEEDLTDLVRALMGREDVMSLVACLGERIVGHVLYSFGGPDAARASVALLGPLLVDPDLHGQGVGTALVKHSFDLLGARGTEHVCVLGDPAYYGRFGFVPHAPVAAPYDLPEAWRAAWQGLAFDGAGPAPERLNLPEPWMRPELWLP